MSWEGERMLLPGVSPQVGQEELASTAIAAAWQRNYPLLGIVDARSYNPRLARGPSRNLEEAGRRREKRR